jgi:FMN phosphatase YigB (HAD superfamily)
MSKMRVIALDFGHTVMDERKDVDMPLNTRPVHLMPQVVEVLPSLRMPIALWANTRIARETEVRHWLARAGIETYFRWVVTSVDAGFRKPQPGFFGFALARCGVARDEVLFVGNQLSTDIRGGEDFGIKTVWPSGRHFQSW